MKIIVSILLTLFGAELWADEVLPAGCVPVQVKGESVMLSADKPQVIMIHNQSKTDLWITHPVSEQSASAGWSSRLQGGNWSALALDKKAFELSCIESRPGHEQQIPCSGVVAVCKWSGMTVPSQSSGTYWAGEDMALSALTAHLGGRGFELPASTQ